MYEGVLSLATKKTRGNIGDQNLVLMAHPSRSGESVAGQSHLVEDESLWGVRDLLEARGNSLKVVYSARRWWRGAKIGREEVLDFLVTVSASAREIYIFH